VTPSSGDLWPRGHSIRSARGSTVLRGNGRVTLSLTDREHCRTLYVLNALSGLLGERYRVGRGGDPMGLILLSDRLPTPPCPARADYPVAPLAPIMDTKSDIKDGHNKTSKGNKGNH